MAEPLREEGGGTQKVLHCCGMGDKPGVRNARKAGPGGVWRKTV